MRTTFTPSVLDSMNAKQEKEARELENTIKTLQEGRDKRVTSLTLEADALNKQIDRLQKAPDTYRKALKTLLTLLDQI